jgi:hypothetical protein
LAHREQRLPVDLMTARPVTTYRRSQVSVPRDQAVVFRTACGQAVEVGTHRWRDGWAGVLSVLALKVVGAFLLWLLFFHDELDRWWAWLSLALIVITAIAYVIAYASYRSSDVSDGPPTT